ncbi:MAG TPA: Ppx/GppA phosphatase family protein [Syntrophorhabdaceae bacterium]|nr:Ppx/GppA phosphatase family protein [Syntrophorhabdaceae bacterium]HPU30807.1 Ppx/GppA phosphatase family protein [Syntrophorhabdaceae bacterium]
MKYASIDIGTNTVLMLIARVNDKKTLKEILDVSTITRLGEGLKNTGYLQQHAMDRTFVALERYLNITKKHGVDKILCVGTSALREAENSDVFLKRVQKDLGLKIRIISEKEEAYYTYLSVIYDQKINCDECVIVDIGGGSTEIIRANKLDFIDFISIPIGAVKLTETFIKHDPPLKTEIINMRRYIKENLNVLFNGDRCTFVGTGGTITNVASIKKGLTAYKKEYIHGMAITDRDIDGVIQFIMPLNAHERKNIPGLEAEREDIILQGIILLKEIMEYFSFNRIIVSANGVRFGVLFERLKIEFL